MKISIRLLIVLLFTGFVTACSNIPHQKANETMEPLVDVAWLNQHIDDENLIILDTSVIISINENGEMSSISGRDQFDEGHIPTARFADLKGNLSAESDFDFVMPTPQQFQQAMSELGVGENSRVVLYSVCEQSWPARVWWMLRWAGFNQVAILDGGFRAWTTAGLPISTEMPSYAKKSFPLNLRPKIIASQKEVMNAINNKDIDIIDAMPEAHYTGMFSMYAQPGHIPTVNNFPSSRVVDESGFNKSANELEELFKSENDHRIITYCGGGVSASNLAFTLYRLGYKDVAVYMGSLQEWTANPENPMTTESTGDD